MIACSGGADSVALAHLLVHFGKRIVHRENIRLVHVNHHWRQESSVRDAQFVAALAQAWGVEAIILDQEKIADTQPRGESPEAWARKRRHELMEQVRKRGEWIFSAHHADDVAETLIWRFFTGQLLKRSPNPVGILPKHGHWVRPMLRVRKNDLKQYLNDVNQEWREDESNAWDGLLRSEMRKSLMPEIQRIFPRAVENLAEWAGTNASARLNPGFEQEPSWLQALMVGLRAKQFQELEKQLRNDTGSIQFRDGLNLEWDRKKPYLRLWKQGSRD